MAAKTLHQEIEKELLDYLERLSYQQLRQTKRKECRLYLEKKLNQSLSKQKNIIKSVLIQYIQNVALKIQANNIQKKPGITHKSSNITQKFQNKAHTKNQDPKNKQIIENKHIHKIDPNVNNNQIDNHKTIRKRKFDETNLPKQVLNDTESHTHTHPYSY